MSPMASFSFKDLFSPQAADYARFRPDYPADLFRWLADQAPARTLAVDVGAGNGQASVALAAHFQHVIGLEPSAAQLASAQAADRVEYRVGAAENTGLDRHSADLMTVAQAFHWFRQEPFFAEVRRVVRPGGCLAVWCYGLARITPAVDAAVFALYEELLGPYWDPERRLVESGYATVSFPFTALEVPAFGLRLTWSRDHLLGYLGTWSALKRYQRERGAAGDAALEAALRAIAAAWGQERTRPVDWPLSVRAFRV